MITTTAYGRIGWLGWLYVKTDRRGKGLGEQLMRHGIDYLNRVGCHTILLEAVHRAVPLYERLGFRRQFPTRHWLICSPTDSVAGSADITVEPFRPDQLPELAAFDALHFGSDRSRMLEIAAANRNFAGWVAHRYGTLRGFLFTARTSQNRQVSPLLADGDRDQLAITSALIQAAFAAKKLPLYLRCPEIVPEKSDLLRRLGAEPGPEQTVRMYLGDPYQPESAAVLSLGCPGKG